MRKKGLWVVLMLALALAVAGCGKDDKGDGGANNDGNFVMPTDPVTIDLFAKTMLLEEDFERYIKIPISLKYPHITINKIESAPGNTINELLVSNNIPDLIWDGLTNTAPLIQLEVPVPLDDLIKKHNFDLDRIDEQVVKSIRSYNSDETLHYLPYRVLQFANHYNKGIFDQFGVDYPKDGATWDETIELGRRLTRTVDGINYRGLHAGINLNRMQTQRSAHYVDPATEQAAILQSDEWRLIFDTFQRIYSIPGNWPQGATFGDARRGYLIDRNLAMFPHIILIGDADFQDSVEQGLEWGISTYPTFPDRPDIGTGIFSDGFIIPQGGKHQDIVFSMVAHLLSDEVQMMAAKMGSISALTSQPIRDAIFAENPYAQGQNLGRLMSVRVADPFLQSEYDTRARAIVQSKVQQFFTGQKDMNTAMREAEEEINQHILAEKSK